MRALFSGLSASILGISHALIYFPLYEKTKLYFRRNYEQPNSEKLRSRYVFISAILSKSIFELIKLHSDFKCNSLSS